MPGRRSDHNLSSDATLRQDLHLTYYLRRRGRNGHSLSLWVGDLHHVPWLRRLGERHWCCSPRWAEWRSVQTNCQQQAQA